MEVKAGPQDLRTVTIVRADDGSVGLRFLRPDDATAGPFEVSFSSYHLAESVEIWMSEQDREAFVRWFWG